MAEERLKMAKSNHGEDLDLLLSLQDRVLETPPASPASSPPSGYLSDDGLSKTRGKVDMSVFREAVEDCLDYDLQAARKSLKSKSIKSSDNTPEVERFSGLRIRNQVVSSVELSNRFSDIRFLRLSAIKNLLNGDTLSGCWATVGVLIERGAPRPTSTGKTYTIWKMSSLNETTVSVFLFGDAYQKYCNEKVGTVFALFNSGVRKDKSENGFSLSVYTASNILKMGTSSDFAVCNGKKKDGLVCNAIIDKRKGIYCRYHKQKTSEKYSFTRAEYKGGNLKTAFRGDMTPEGIYLVDRSGDRKTAAKSKAPLKLLSVEGLKKALSNAGKTTTNMYSQGIRFLTEMTVQPDQVQSSKCSDSQTQRSSSHVQKGGSRDRVEKESGAKRSKIEKVEKESGAKRSKIEKVEKESCAKRSKIENQCVKEKGSEVGMKMIELDFVSSDDE